MARNARAGICPNGGCARHRHQFTIGTEVGGKIGAMLLGGALGGATKHPLGVLGGALLGALIGHEIDEKVLPTCPECGVALRIVGGML